MRVGDSFLVSDVADHSARQAAYAAGKRYGRKFTTRKEVGGTRIFRIA